MPAIPKLPGQDIALAALGPFGEAISAVTGVLNQLVDQSRSFVQALSPATISAFDQTFRNLQATIGSGLLPIFGVLIDVIQEVSGIILPVFEELAPIVKTLSDFIGSALINVVRVLVTIFEILKPIIQLIAINFETMGVGLSVLATALQSASIPLQILTSLLSSLIEFFQPFIDEITNTLNQFMEVWQALIKTIVQTIVQFITSLFGSGDSVRDGLRGFVDGLKQALLTIIAFTARVGRLFFGDEFIQRFLGNLERPQGLVAAPQNIGIKSFEQIAKDLAVASVAAGAGQQDRDVDFLRQIQESLQGILNTAPQTFREILNGFADQLAQAIARSIRGEGARQIDGALGVNPNNSPAAQQAQRIVGAHNLVNNPFGFLYSALLGGG